MENELVSVIVAIYNIDKYLDDCIRSIIKQSYKNLEILLVNDGSTDNSEEICKKWAKKIIELYYVAKRIKDYQ